LDQFTEISPISGILTSHCFQEHHLIIEIPWPL